MPTEIQLDGLPSGIAQAIALPGEMVRITAAEFLSSENGSDFIQRLETIENMFQAFFGLSKVFPSQVDHFVAIIRKDRTATVYCNELEMVTLTTAKRQIVTGSPISKDDIADIARLELHTNGGTPVEFPPDAGVVLILSHRWRKGLFYDFNVFHNGEGDRKFDLPAYFGHLYARLLFQELFSISEIQWTRLFSWGWFPFIGLSTEDRHKLLGWADTERDPTSALQEICKSFKTTLKDRIAAWQNKRDFAIHAPFINTALERYEAGDFISAISVLYFRIEGIMQALHLTVDASKRPSQKEMTNTLTGQLPPTSLLLPTKFKEYLTKHYFCPFDLTTGDVPFSRNTVGHGVADANEFTFVRATVAFLIIDQMAFFTK
jgi:hypothetical protein